MSNQNEKWSNIKNYPNYQCSNTGKIRHFTKNIWILSKFRKNHAGYYLVNLYNNKSKKDKTFSVHRIIALNLIPNPQKYPIINHIDGNKENNNILNLEWCDYKHNSQHAFRLGLVKDIRGENNYGAKLTFEKVNEIRKKYLTGKYTYINLREEYNLSYITIKRIIRNQAWFDIRFDNESYYNTIKQIQLQNKSIATQEIRRKLSNDNIKLIRELYWEKNLSINELSKMFKVSSNNINHIIKNKTWKDINYNFSIEKLKEKQRQNFILKNNKATKNIVNKINDLYSKGLTQLEIGNEVGLSQTRVGEILRGENLKTILS